MSLFLGLGDTYKIRGVGQQANTRQQLAMSPAQVLDVCLDSTSPLYTSTADIGAIRFQLIGIGESGGREFEDQTNNIAHPLDRSIARYPVAGEQVMIYSAVGDRQRQSADHDQLSLVPFYSLVVSSMMNITYNGHPFMSHNEKRIREDRVLTKQEAASRFEQRIDDLALFKDDRDQIKIFKQLQPFEGDFILQGRFGNSIRFGSTSATSNAPWAPILSGAPGMSGDPLMILRVDRDNTTSVAEMLTVEDVNNDDSSIYICSSQTVELQLSCSARMKSWVQTFGLEDSKSKATTDVLKSI